MALKLKDESVHDCVAYVQHMFKTWGMSLNTMAVHLDVPTSTLQRWVHGPTNLKWRRRGGYKSPFRRTADRVVARIESLGWKWGSKPPEA